MQNDLILFNCFAETEVWREGAESLKKILKETSRVISTQKPNYSISQEYHRSNFALIQ